MTRHVLWLAAAGMLLTACGSGDSTVAEDPPSDEGPRLLTTRYPVTVLDDGDGAELCLGAVAESWPPQCGGPRLVGWSWADHEGHYEEANGVRWGSFAVVGEYDGTAFTPSEILPAAEWEGEPPRDRVDDGPMPSVAKSDRELRQIQRELTDRTDVLAAYIDDDAGRVVLEVVHDDGSLQARLDDRHGRGVVLVVSALVPAS